MNRNTHVEACGWWSEDIGRLARGTLDHNSKRATWVCMRICFTFTNTQIPKRPRVCLKCWVILPLPPFWFPARWVFLQSHSSELCDCVCVHNWLTRGRTMQGRPTVSSPLLSLYSAPAAVRLCHLLLPPFSLLSRCSQLPRSPHLCPPVTRSVKHKYHSLST